MLKYLTILLLLVHCSCTNKALTVKKQLPLGYYTLHTLDSTDFFYFDYYCKHEVNEKRSRNHIRCHTMKNDTLILTRGAHLHADFRFNYLKNQDKEPIWQNDTLIFQMLQDKEGYFFTALESRPGIPDTLRLQAYSSEINQRFLAYEGSNYRIYNNQIEFTSFHPTQSYQGSFSKQDSVFIPQYFNRLLTYPRDTFLYRNSKHSHGASWDNLYSRDTLYSYNYTIFHSGPSLLSYLLTRTENAQENILLNNTQWNQFKATIPENQIHAWEIKHEFPTPIIEH